MSDVCGESRIIIPPGRPYHPHAALGFAHKARRQVDGVAEDGVLGALRAANHRAQELPRRHPGDAPRGFPLAPGQRRRERHRGGDGARGVVLVRAPGQAPRAYRQVTLLVAAHLEQCAVT